MFLDFSSMKINTYEDHIVLNDAPQPQNLNDLLTRSVPLSEIETKNGYTGKFVCVTSSVDENQRNVRVRPCMISKISTLKRCKEQLCYVSTEHLFETAYVVPNSFYDGPSILPCEIMVYHPVHTWASSVIDRQVILLNDDDHQNMEEDI